MTDYFPCAFWGAAPPSISFFPVCQLLGKGPTAHPVVQARNRPPCSPIPPGPACISLCGAIAGAPRWAPGPGLCDRQWAACLSTPHCKQPEGPRRCRSKPPLSLLGHPSPKLGEHSEPLATCALPAPPCCTFPTQSHCPGLFEELRDQLNYLSEALHTVRD